MIELEGCLHHSKLKFKYRKHDEKRQEYRREQPAFEAKNRRKSNNSIKFLQEYNISKKVKLSLEPNSRIFLKRSPETNKLSYSKLPSHNRFCNVISATTLAAAAALATLGLTAFSQDLGLLGSVGGRESSASLQLTPNARACITATYLCVLVVNSTLLDCNLLETLCNNNSNSLRSRVASIANARATNEIGPERSREILESLLTSDTSEVFKLEDIGQLALIASASKPYSHNSDTETSLQNDWRPNGQQFRGGGVTRELQYLKPRKAMRDVAALTKQDLEGSSTVNPNFQLNEGQKLNSALQFHDARWIGSDYIRRLISSGSNLQQAPSNGDLQTQSSTTTKTTANNDSTMDQDQTTPMVTWQSTDNQGTDIGRPQAPTTSVTPTNNNNNNNNNPTSTILPSWLGRPFRAWSTYSFWSPHSSGSQSDLEYDETITNPSHPIDHPISAHPKHSSSIQILRPVDRSEHIVSIIDMSNNHSSLPSQQFHIQSQSNPIEESRQQQAQQNQASIESMSGEPITHNVPVTEASLASLSVITDVQPMNTNQLIILDSGNQLRPNQAITNQPIHTNSVYLDPGSSNTVQVVQSGSQVKTQDKLNQNMVSSLVNNYDNPLNNCRCDDLLFQISDSQQDLMNADMIAAITALSIPAKINLECRTKCSSQFQHQQQSQSKPANSILGGPIDSPNSIMIATQETDNSMSSSTEVTQVPFLPNFGHQFSSGSAQSSGATNGNSKVSPVDVSFLLYTRYHRNLANELASIIGAGPHNLASIAASNLVSTGEVVDFTNETILSDLHLNASLPVKIVIHGFGSGGRKSWVADMVYKLLEYEDVNVIVVDWEKGAALPNYVQAAGNTRFVGHKIATLIKMINGRYGLSGNSYHLIGFSLGAHVAGFAGMEIRNSTLLPRLWINRITGLDPASPLFEGYEANDRLDPGDAQFVDVIHSNGDGVLRGGFGSLQPMGHVDFYPNGGRVQVGCNSVLLSALSDIIYGKWQSLCNHRRALNFFMDSFEFTKCRFRSFNCDSYESFLKGECFDCGPNNEKCSYMGYLANYSKGRGKMYLTTHEEAPFCANQLLIRISGTKGYKTNWGKVEVTLLTMDGKNESFWLSSSMSQQQVNQNQESAGGSQRDTVQMNLQSLIVTHQTLVNFTQILLRYTKYKGWIYSGDESWSLDKVSLMDSDGQMKSYCGYNTVLESHVITRLKLEPGNCTISEPIAERTNTDQNSNPGQQQSNLNTKHPNSSAQQQTPQFQQIQPVSQSRGNPTNSGRTARLIAAILDTANQQQLINGQQQQMNFQGQFNGPNSFQRIMPVLTNDRQQRQLGGNLQNQLTVEYLNQVLG